MGKVLSDYPLTFGGYQVSSEVLLSAIWSGLDSWILRYTFQKRLEGSKNRDFRRNRGFFETKKDNKGQK